MPTKLRESPPMKESQLVKLCLDWLRAEKILAWRNNTGAMKGSYKGKPRFVRFGEPGLPDIIAVIPLKFEERNLNAVWTYKVGQFIAIECKAEKGIWSKAQQDFNARLQSVGGKYLLVRSLEDLQKGLGR